MSKNLQAELCGPNTSMLEVRFEQLKPTYDTLVIHFDYTLEQAIAWTKKKRSLRNGKLKANKASETEE